MELQDKDVLIFIWSVICEGAIGVILLLDHNSSNPIAELESYLETFKKL